MKTVSRSAIINGHQNAYLPTSQAENVVHENEHVRRNEAKVYCCVCRVMRQVCINLYAEQS